MHRVPGYARVNHEDIGIKSSTRVCRVSYLALSTHTGVRCTRPQLPANTAPCSGACAPALASLSDMHATTCAAQPRSTRFAAHAYAADVARSWPESCVGSHNTHTHTHTHKQTKNNCGLWMRGSGRRFLSSSVLQSPSCTDIPLLAL